MGLGEDEAEYVNAIIVDGRTRQVTYYVAWMYQEAVARIKALEESLREVLRTGTLTCTDELAALVHSDDLGFDCDCENA